MTAADQIARRSQCAARYAAINRGRFARRIRPSKRWRGFASFMPRDGKQDMWRTLETVLRTPQPTREFWMQAERKKMASAYMLKRGKFRVWLDNPAFVMRRNSLNCY